MAWWDGVPSQSPGAAGWWGGQGFGGFGNQAVPQQPVAPMAPQQAPPAAMVGPSIANLWGGRGVAGPGQQWGTTPGGSFTSPTQQQPGLWDRLMNLVGTQGMPKMPGTTVGAPAGQTPPALPPAPMLPQGQMPGLPGLGAYFRAQQFPAAATSSNPNLMAQYMALQQLMRGS